MDMEALTFSSPTTRRLGTAYLQSGVDVMHGYQLRYLLPFSYHIVVAFSFYVSSEFSGARRGAFVFQYLLYKQ